MSNGCVLGATCNKPIRVSSPIPFKSQLRSQHGRFAIYAAEFAGTKTERFSREETYLLVCEQTIYGTCRIPPKPPKIKHNNNLLHCNPFIFNICHVCVLLRIPMCITSRVYIRCVPTYRRILLTRPLNSKKKYCTIDFSLVQVSVGQWRSLFQLPQNSNVPTMCSWANRWTQVHLRFKQRGAGRENDSCVGLKLAKITCVVPGAALHSVW